MKKLRAAIWAEGLKVLCSKMFWITILFFSFITIILALMMFILKNPELARNTGLLGAKAQLVGEADWPSYFAILSQVIAIGGLVGFGFIASWVFGREYSDGTAKDLLALPVSRYLIILAKFIVMSAWCIFLSLIVLGLGLIAGYIVDLDFLSRQVFYNGLQLLAVTSILTIVLSTPVAFVASYGRGFLAPMGFVVLTIVVSQIAAALGHGVYIPWAIPALYSGAAGAEHTHLGNISFLLVFVTAVLGFIATLLWWRFADQK